MKRSIQPRHLSTRQGGFSLIELMIVVAIIAILAAIAMPQYQNYVAKSQTAAALAEITPGKVGVETIYAEGGALATTPAALGLPATTPRCTNITPTMAANGAATLTCAMRVAGLVEGNLVWSRNDDGVWTCSTTMARTDLVPAICRA